jgi:hypothetical protein
MSKRSFGSLVGYSISNGGKYLGKVEQIVEITENDKQVFVAVLDNGKGIRMAFLAKLLSQQHLYLLKRNDEYIIYAFPNDTHVSKAKFGPQRKRIVSPAASGSVNNTATIGDEKVNITSHISSGNPVYYNKEKMGER